jgi:hypothetical protein
MVPRQTGCSGGLLGDGFESGSAQGCGSGCTASSSAARTPLAGSAGRGGSWTRATSALFEGDLTGPSPVDRARTGSKHHLLVDAAGVPLADTLTGGNRNDITQLLPLVDGITPERDPVVHVAFLTLACSLICRRYLWGFRHWFFVPGGDPIATPWTSSRTRGGLRTTSPRATGRKSGLASPPRGSPRSDTPPSWFASRRHVPRVPSRWFRRIPKIAGESIGAFSFEVAAADFGFVSVADFSPVWARSSYLMARNVAHRLVLHPPALGVALLGDGSFLPAPAHARA